MENDHEDRVLFRYQGGGSQQMKVLFIGGTGQISSAVVRRLTKEKDTEVWLLNRGNRAAPEGVHQIIADVKDEAKVADAIEGMTFDTVCELDCFRER